MSILDLLKTPSPSVVFGVAGARKTSLAVQLAKSTPRKTFLYLSFGRENTSSASLRFPDNTVCLNFHTLAKKILNIPSSRIVERIDMLAVQGALSAMGISCKDMHLIESTVILLEHFVTSGLPINQLRRLLMHSDFSNLHRQDKEFVAYLLTQFWMFSFNENQPVSHDMYLKEATLRVTVLPYDVLLVDECQDLNDAMYHWVDNMRASTPGLKVVKLGDPAQQIFSFMGASERFLFEKPDLIMTKSYRFGPEIGDFVNAFMSKHPLPYFSDVKTDAGVVSHILPFSDDNSAVDFIRNHPGESAVVAQYNLTILQWMIRLTKAGLTYHILGNIHAKERSQIQALFKLLHFGECDFKAWRFRDYNWVKEDAKLRGDKALLLACRFIEGLSKGDGELLGRVLKGKVADRKHADVVLTTIHQAKGLEFNYVVVAPDLPGENSSSRLSRSETHRVYTTLTRAKKAILYPEAYF